MYIFHSKLCSFVIFPYIHTYTCACMHTCTFIDGLSFFSKDLYKYNNIYIYAYMCVSCVFFMFSGIHIQKAEVLSARFPKEYDHINSCSEASQVVYIFHSKLCLFVIFPYIHTYIYACMHTCTFIDGLSFFQRYV